MSPVGPAVGPRGDYDVFDVLDSWNVVQEVHREGGNLMLLHAWPDKLGNGRMAAIADGGDDAHRFQLIFVFDRARFHHGRCAVGVIYFGLFEGVDHIEVDEVDAYKGFLDMILAQFLHDRVGEFFHLLSGSAAYCSFDPRVGVAHVVARDPGAVAIDLYPDVSLFEKDRLRTFAK